METPQRIICQWCQTQNLIGATTCHSCGAPLDVRNVIAIAGAFAPAALPSAPAPLNYCSATIVGDVNWTTVATFQYCGELHAARALLSRMNIVSRIGPAPDDAPEFDLQAPAAEAGLAQEILRRTAPRATAIARPTGGFPVIMANAAPNAVGTRRALAPAPLPVGVGHPYTLALLWIMLAVVVLSILFFCFA